MHRGSEAGNDLGLTGRPGSVTLRCRSSWSRRSTFMPVSTAGARPSTSWRPHPARRGRARPAGDLDAPSGRRAGLSCRGLARLRGLRGSARRCRAAASLKPVSSRWGPWNPRRHRSLWVGDAGQLGRQHHGGWGHARVGTWGIALLSRLPIRRVKTIDLGHLRRDSAQRRCSAGRDRGRRISADCRRHASRPLHAGIAHLVGEAPPGAPRRRDNQSFSLET